jgi:hypothetical protein
VVAVSATSVERDSLGGRCRVDRPSLACRNPQRLIGHPLDVALHDQPQRRSRRHPIFDAQPRQVGLTGGAVKLVRGVEQRAHPATQDNAGRPPHERPGCSAVMQAFSLRPRRDAHLGQHQRDPGASPNRRNDHCESGRRSHGYISNMRDESASSAYGQLRSGQHAVHRHDKLAMTSMSDELRADRLSATAHSLLGEPAEPPERSPGAALVGALLDTCQIPRAMVQIKVPGGLPRTRLRVRAAEWPIAFCEP